MRKIHLGLWFAGAAATVGMGSWAAGCGSYATLFVNQTASLGGGSAAIPLGGAGAQASPRGDLRVLFINNTPYRAVFSAGAYDAASRHSSIDLVQFGANDADANLEADTATGIGTFTCARQVGIGDTDLLRLMTDDFNVVPLVESATIPGVEFFEIMEDGSRESRGSAAARVVNIGAEFRCESLLIFRFELNDVGDMPFRIDYEVVPAASTRQ